MQEQRFLDESVLFLVLFPRHDEIDRARDDLCPLQIRAVCEF